MVITHPEWIGGVVFLASSLLFAVSRAARRHVANRAGNRS